MKFTLVIKEGEDIEEQIDDIREKIRKKIISNVTKSKKKKVYINAIYSYKGENQETVDQVIKRKKIEARLLIYFMILYG